MKKIAILLILLIFLLFFSFQKSYSLPVIDEGSYAKYSAESEITYITFLNKTIIFIDNVPMTVLYEGSYGNAYIEFLWEIDKKIEINKYLIKIFVKIVTHNATYETEGEGIIDINEGKVWFKNGTYLGRTLLFLPLTLEENNIIKDVGLYENFNLKYFSSGISIKIPNHGYQTAKSYSLISKIERFTTVNHVINLPKGYSIQTIYYDEDAGIALIFPADFHEPIFFLANIFSLATTFNLIDTNLDLGPTYLIPFFIEFIPYFFAAVIVILIIYFYRKKVKKKLR